MKKSLLIIVFILALSVLISCKKTEEKKDIRFYIWNDNGDTPLGFNEVLKYFNENYGDDLGLNIDFKFDTQDDFKQNLNLNMSAKNDSFDVVFDANWIFLGEFAKRGYYHNLESYFNNEKYPGLKKAFSPEFIRNNLFSDGVYGIPLTQTFGEISVAYIRKDFRIEASLDTNYVKHPSISTSSVTNVDLANGIDNFEELEYYLYWVKANKNGVIPALSNKEGTWGAWDLISTMDMPSKSAQNKVDAGIKDDILIKQGLTASAFIRNGEVFASNVGNFMSPTIPNGISQFPSGFNSNDNAWQKQYQKARTWFVDGIIDPDVMSETGSDSKFKAGNGGAMVQTINNFSSVEQALKAGTPSAELEIYVNNPTIRNKMIGYDQTDFKAWNFLCVPTKVSKEKLDKIMSFFNWLFLNEENHDLFQYGIKGKHWDNAKNPEGVSLPNTVTTTNLEPYTFPAYELTWNPNYIKVSYASDPKVMEYSQYMFDSTRYVEIIYSGFQFDVNRTPALKNAVDNAILASKLNLDIAYRLGQINNPVASWNNELTSSYNNSALQEAIRLIQEELISQLQDYIDKQ